MRFHPTRSRKDIAVITAGKVSAPILIIFFLIFAHNAFSQSSPTFRHLSTKDGLSQGVVVCMLQDSKGFIWIGTQNGLNRYDGYSFTHYYATPFDSNGLQSNSILALCEDSSGTIWIGTQDKGLNSLDRKTGKITHYMNENYRTSSISSNKIHCFFIDSKKRLWIGTESGLNYFNPKTKSFLRYEFSTNVVPFSNTNRLSSIAEGDNGNLIIESENGIFLFNPKRGSSLPILRSKDHSDENIYYHIWDLGNQWLTYFYGSDGTTSTLASVDIKTGAILERYCTLPRTIIHSIQKKDSETYYICSSIGLYLLHTKSKDLERMEIFSDYPRTTSAQNVHSMLTDRNGNFWIGTFDGIYILENNTSFSHNLLSLSGDHNGKSKSHTVRSLYYSKRGKLLAGTKSGLIFRWDSLNRKFTFSMSLLRNKSIYEAHPINAMIEDSHQGLWLAVTNGPFYHEENGVLKNLFSKHDKTLDPPMGQSGHSFYEDHDGNLWLGVTGIVSHKVLNDFLKYDPSTKAVKTYRYFNQTNSSNEEHGVFSFLEDKNGKFWLATANGLFLFDRVSEKFTAFQYDLKNKNSISSNNVWVLHEDLARNFWIGTWGGGLNLFDRAKGTFSHFTEKEGLPSNVIYSILEAGDGTLWIATAHGISHFNPLTKVFTNYDKGDGLLDDEFQPNAAVMLPSGEMFFGGTNGVTSFFPDKISSKNTYSPLAITSFSILGTQRYSELSNGDHIELSYNENDFSFDFATLDLKSTAKKRYAYMLEGLDDDWIQAENRNLAGYNNVPPGSYIIRIKAINNQDLWGNEIAIKLRITPPFWATWWFSTIGILLILGFILFGEKRRVRKKQELEASLDYARETERFNIAGELHDGPLQDLYATRFILEGPEIEISKSSTTVLDGLLKKVRSDLRSITGELQIPKFETGFTDEIRFFAENFQESHPELKVRIDTQEPQFELPSLTQQNIFRIYRSTLANIVKHANAKNVYVSFVTNQHSLSLVIQDDGVGFNPAAKSERKGKEKHYGMLLNEHYADVIGATLQIISSPGKGTTVVVNFEKPRHGMQKFFKRKT